MHWTVETMDIVLPSDVALLSKCAIGGSEVFTLHFVSLSERNKGKA